MKSRFANRSLTLWVTAFLSPLMLAGLLLGYVVRYNRKRNREKGIYPYYPDLFFENWQNLSTSDWIDRAWQWGLGMLGGLLGFMIALAAIVGSDYAIIQILGMLFSPLLILYGIPELLLTQGFQDRFMIGFLTTNFLVGGSLCWIFSYKFILRRYAFWMETQSQFIDENARHGTARFAGLEDVSDLQNPIGLYIGTEPDGRRLYFPKNGHLLTVAGTRSGKGANLVVPNLLQNTFQGSWVVVDPKGENAAITAEYQASLGRRVVLFNPWQILDMPGSTFNPLDVVSQDRLSFSDDCRLVAEALIPNPNTGEVHWAERARGFVSGMIAHLLTACPPKDRHLGTIWSWLRLSNDGFIELLGDMSVNDHPVAGELVRAVANDVAAMMVGKNEFASIMSTAKGATNWLGSVAIRESLVETSDFSLSDLAGENCTVYLVIPPDAPSAYLRLCIAALMREVIRDERRPRTCFLIDEFFAVGRLSIIEIALASYAGYGLTVWPVLQDLTQLSSLYGRNWETYMGQCAVRHFFNQSDMFSLDYLSRLFGDRSMPNFRVNEQTGEVALTGSTTRKLMTTDEIRRSGGNSADNGIIWAMIEQRPVMGLRKQPYWLWPDLSPDPNPYHKRS